MDKKRTVVFITNTNIVDHAWIDVQETFSDQHVQERAVGEAQMQESLAITATPVEIETNEASFACRQRRWELFFVVYVVVFLFYLNLDFGFLMQKRVPISMLDYLVDWNLIE